jgi:hypothetical protein
MGLRPTQGDEKTLSVQHLLLHGSTTLPFVIPSVPGFPVSGTREGSVCGFLKGKPHEDRDAANLDRKSGAAEGSAVQYFGPNEFVIPTEA